MSTASIDPRIRARRITVRREEGRRRLRRLVVLLSLAGLLGLAALATRTPLLDVDRVEVAGATHTPAADIVAAAGVKPGDPLTDVDTSRATRGVAALPWVARVVVEKDWPGTIRIEVHEREAVAMVAAGEAWVLVDSSGRALEATTAPPPGIMAIGGVDTAPAVGSELGDEAADALAVAAVAPPEVTFNVAVIGPAERGLEMALHAGGIVRFGPPAELPAKFLAIRTVLEEVDLECLATLDVRVPSVPVLTREDGCG